MIATIRKGTSFSRAARYLFGPGEHVEHVDPRVLTGGQVLLGDERTWQDWVADMRFCAGLRTDVTRPVWHCSLRAAPEDPVLADCVWAAVARQLVASMGLVEYPWVAVRHGADHVHIVAGRVNAYGRVWRDSSDYARVMRAARAAENEHGLVVVDDRHGYGRSSLAPRVRAQSRT